MIESQAALLLLVQAVDVLLGGARYAFFGVSELHVPEKAGGEPSI